jgi:hypothetical protein
MNELTLSSDINVITTEIKSYQQIGGQAIFEIGRRLKWVKEHDLVRGEFGPWLKKIDMQPRMAQRFIKVASDESLNTTSMSHLGIAALYEIATMPIDDKEAPIELPSGKTKKLTDMTVSELRETKAALKSLQAKNKVLRDENLSLHKQPPKVEVHEVPPADYADLKAERQKLQSQIKSLHQRNEYLENEQKDLLEQRDQFSEDSTEYQQLQRKMQELAGKASSTERKLAAASDILKFKGNADELLNKLAPALYAYDFAEFKPDDPAMRSLSSLLNRVEKWCADMHRALPDDYLEGEVVDEG